MSDLMLVSVDVYAADGFILGIVFYQVNLSQYNKEGRSSFAYSALQNPNTSGLVSQELDSTVWTMIYFEIGSKCNASR